MGTLPGRVEFQEGHKDLADRPGHCSPHYSWLDVGERWQEIPHTVTTYSPAVLLYPSFRHLTHFISVMSVRLGKRQRQISFSKQHGRVKLKPCMSVFSRRPEIFTKKPVAQISVRSHNIHFFLPPLPLPVLSETQLRVGIC